jgi:hypothetical protein
MTFQMPWRMRQTLAEAGKLPTPLATIYVDFDAGVNGAGTQASPYNTMPGLSVGDTRVTFGYRVVCKGTWHSSTANFGQLLRAGASKYPIVYVGNDPSWGQAIIDGSVALTAAACTSQANALGNTNWASMRRATISAGLGGVDPDDYLHCLYAGADREVRYLAGYPQLANDDAFDWNQFCPNTSLADVWWYSGINESSPVFSAGVSAPRINLAAAETSMGLTAGTLTGALDSNCVPVLIMRISPNVWFTARMGRCDQDGTLNSAGAYIKVIDGNTLDSSSANYTLASDYKFRIVNVPKAISGSKQYAINPAAGWLVEWPVSNEQLYRGQGKSGLQFAANNVWLHGFKICGMSCSNTVANATGAGGGNSLSAASTIDTTTIRIQRCLFPGFGSIGPKSRQQAYDDCAHAQRYFNTYQRQVIGSAVQIGTGSGAIVKYNNFQYIHGSNVRVIATGTSDAVRNVTVAGNLIEHVNDLHGNGITLYCCKYNVLIEGNLIRDTGRPLTSERDNAYNTATYGQPSCIVRNNTFQASGYGSLAALRWQGGDEMGLQASNNTLDGGVLGDLVFAVENTLPLADNGPITGNIGVGAAPTNNSLTFWNSGSNTVYDRASANGLALIASINAMTAPSTTYAPQGVGYTAGGWDGTS